MRKGRGNRGCKDIESGSRKGLRCKPWGHGWGYGAGKEGDGATAIGGGRRHRHFSLRTNEDRRRQIQMSL